MRVVGQARQAVVPLAAVVGVLLVLAAGAWSFSPSSRSVTALPGTLRVGSGLVHVDQVLSAARPQHAMAGMGTDDDPVADGRRRVSVEVTLRATGEAPLRFSVDRFGLATGPGPVERPHRSVLPESELPPGTQLSGTLVFDVPRDAEVGHLSYAGTDPLEIQLPAEELAPGPAHTTEHDPASASS